MDTRPEFPQYYHVEDLVGNVFAVVCREHETSYTVIQRRDVRKSFIVSKVTSEAAVKEAAPGQMLGASAHDYDEVLKKEFGFTLSRDALHATYIKSEGKLDAEKSESLRNPTVAQQDVPRVRGSASGGQEETGSGAPGMEEVERPGKEGGGEVHQATNAGAADSPVNDEVNDAEKSDGNDDGRKEIVGDSGKSDKAAPQTQSSNEVAGNSEPVQRTPIPTGQPANPAKKTT